MPTRTTGPQPTTDPKPTPNPNGKPKQVAFHKLDDDKPLIRISRMVAGLLWVAIRGNQESCKYLYGHVTSLKP